MKMVDIWLIFNLFIPFLEVLLHTYKVSLLSFHTKWLRGAVKYYFADFVRNPLFAERKIRKGGEGVPPKSVTYFLDQNQVFFEQKTPFLALF